MENKVNSASSSAQRKHDAVLIVIQDNVFHRIIVTEGNLYASDLTGYAPEELQDLDFSALLPEDMRFRLRDRVTYRDRSPQTVGAALLDIRQFRIHAKDGTLVPVYCQVEPLPDEDIHPRFQLILRDDSLRRDIIAHRSALEMRPPDLHERDEGAVGLPGEDALEQALSMVLYHVRNRRMEAAMALVRIDNIDFISAGYGETSANLLMRGLGNVCRSNVRDEDTVARYGDDMIALVLTGADPKGVQAVMNRLRFIVSSNSLPLNLYEDIVVTLSIGVYAIRSGDSHEAICDQAFLALQDARQQGGDSVVDGGDKG